jgi:signal transduction histidine kinase
MRVQLTNIENIVIKNDFTTECSKCIADCNSVSIKISCPLYLDTRRIGKAKTESGTVFCCSNSKDFGSSSKLFKKEQNHFLIGLNKINDTKNELNIETQRLIHNLTNTNGHNIQELYAVVPQDLLTQNLDEQLENIQKIITENPLEAAKTFLRIAKNNASMKVEFSVINKLMEGASSLKMRRHPIRKATLNLLHIFFQDFKENNVYVKVQENEDYLIFDYEIIHASLYHLLLNATKYIMPKTTLSVNFTKDKGDFLIALDMVSLRIEDDEKNKIFEEGYSGKYAKKTQKAGKGLGLGTTSKMLELNDAQLIIDNNVKPSLSINSKGVWYDYNVFTIKFKNYAQHSV